MILDKELACSVDQSLAGAAAADVASTNAIDLLSANNNIGIGQPVRALVNVTTAFAGGTSVTVDLIQSANPNLSSPDVLATSGAIADATAVAGYRLLNIRVPNTTKRYLGFKYTTVGTHTAATSTVDAHILSDVSHPRYLPSNNGR